MECASSTALPSIGEGRLWVMEADASPKRVSVWDVASGKLEKEFFGPTSYGAMGGAICPSDPLTMVGQGCEWKLDATTGKATCVSVITRDGMQVSRFGDCGAAARLPRHHDVHGPSTWRPVKIYERLGAGRYALRGAILPHGSARATKCTPVAHGQGEVATDELLGR